MKKSVLSKSKINLRDEFEESYFYIDGSDKESILQELNWYNINESTLFPELEHQLNYIKQNSRLFTKPVDGFIKYSLEDDSSTEVISNVQDESIELFNANVKEYITTLVEENLVNEIYTSLQDNMIIDWYKRENIISKMKREIVILISKKKDRAKEIADDIVNYTVNEYIKISLEN